jgi:hypothetical protein
VLSRAAILCDGEKIRAHDLDLAGLSPTATAAPARASAGLTPGRTLKDIVDDAAAAVERAAIARRWPRPAARRRRPPACSASAARTSTTSSRPTG